MTVTTIDMRRMVVCALLLVGCGGGTEPSQSGKPAYVFMGAETGGAVPGISVQFTATATDSAGEVIPGARFEWATQDTFLATVDANGLATAHHPGQVLIYARTGGVEGGLTLTVLEPVASVLLRGVRAPVTPAPNSGFPLSSDPRVGDSLTTTFRSLRWTSSQESVARVDNSGVITAVGPGTTTLTYGAEVEGVAASVDLAVATLEYRTAQNGGPIDCGLTVGKRVYCWGAPYTGLQPDGAELLGVTPWPVHWCAVRFVEGERRDGLRASRRRRALVLGKQRQWPLGDGTFTSRLTPEPVPADSSSSPSCPAPPILAASCSTAPPAAGDTTTGAPSAPATGSRPASPRVGSGHSVPDHLVVTQRAVGRAPHLRHDPRWRRLLLGIE